MPQLFRLFLPLALVAALAVPSVASAFHQDWPRTPNMVPLGESPRPAAIAQNNVNSDLAFWGNYVFQGTYVGFRILDVSNPAAPAVVSETTCGFTQGDITISPDGNTLVRSQDSPRLLPGNNPANACDASTAANATTGWEGLQIFDVSNKAAPRFVAAVYTDCGSHTHTQYHDEANNRLIIYVSRGACTITPGANPYGGESLGQNITAVEVPLANPSAARVLTRRIATPESNGCHDVAVYEEIQRLYGACFARMILWDIADPANPVVRHVRTFPASPAITIWHTAAFSWDGKILIAGHEPGGGGQARCQASSSPTDRTYFFFRESDGTLIGTWTLPRVQTSTENCTLHNANVVPFADRHVLVHGSYQSGTSVVDFTSPSAAREIAFADPPPLSATQLILGGDWSSYWYNHYIYESDITRGLAIWDVAEPWWENAVPLQYLNPQTIEDMLHCTVSVRGAALRARRAGRLTVNVRVNDAVTKGINVRLRGPGVSRMLTTNENGTVTGRFRARRAGTLRVDVPTTLNMSGCGTSRRIAAAPRAPRPPRPPLTGRAA